MNEELIEKMNLYTLKPFGGKMLVLKKMEEMRNEEHCSPDFMGTGLCLDGCLRCGETLEDYIYRKDAIRDKIKKNNHNLPQSLIKKKVFAISKEQLYLEISKDPYFTQYDDKRKRKFTEGFLRIMSKIIEING